MSARTRELLRLDWDQVDVRRGAVGVLAIAATVVFVAVFGNVGLTAGLAVLFVLATDRPGPVRERLVGIAVLTFAGGVLALVGVWAGTEHVGVATVMTLVTTVVATLAAGFGHTAALRGLLLALWAVLALSFAGADDAAWTFAVAYVLGGLVAALFLWAQVRWFADEGAPDVPASSVGDAADGTPAASLAAIVRSPLGLFSLVRGGAVALATLLGIELFPEHAIWPALTVLLILRPKTGETFEAGLLRTIGTLVGVLIGEAVILLAGESDVAVGIAFLIAAFAMITLKNVNYAVFVLCLTAVLLFVQQLLGDDALSAGTQRLLATLLGAGIAFLAMAVGGIVIRHRPTKAPASA